MKEILFQTIGQYEFKIKGKTASSERHVTLEPEFKDALIKLDQFSHCILFTKTAHRLNHYVLKNYTLSAKSGELLLEPLSPLKEIQGDLVDIKPYFPCEEQVDSSDMISRQVQENQQLIPFQGTPIGEYLFDKASGNIQLQNLEVTALETVENALTHIQEGDFLRILWWFHKFDAKKYRSHMMCNPPYEHAPKCGVFATRSPVRPNPLASTVVKVTSVDIQNKRIGIQGFDGFEHSVILQIERFEDMTLEPVEVPAWVGHWTPYKVFKDPLTIETTNSSLNEKSVPNFEEPVFCEALEAESHLEEDFLDTNEIVVENASIHNLKDISVRIPKEKITVITGVSGSGKSSLAFDTIYQESQRQFVDLVASNSPFSTDLKDTSVKRISGLQPSIAIEQKNLGATPRSTVASLTKLGDYLRLLYATMGTAICPHCHVPVPSNHVCDSCGTIFFPLTPAVFNYNHPEYMCPVCKGLGEELQMDLGLIVSNPERSILDGASDWWGNLRKHREKPNANWMKGEVLALAVAMNEDLEVPFQDLSEAFKQQIFYGSGGKEVTLEFENPNGRSGKITRPVEGVVNILNRLLADNSANKSLEHIERFMRNKPCSRCHGERLLEAGRLVKIGDLRYPEASQLSITELKHWCHYLYSTLNAHEMDKSKALLVKLVNRLKKLEQVGLGYLSLDRSVPSLSGGEAQRLKIATQFGTGLSNILYVLDEPSKGLHPKDYQFLIQAIQALKKQKNTILIVEHKAEFLQMADYQIEIGPGAGHYGGELLRSEFRNDSVTAETVYPVYNSKPNMRPTDKQLTLTGARTHNLKNIDIAIPLGQFTCVIGVSGSGKSSLVSGTLYPAVMKALGKRAENLGDYDRINGVEHLTDIYYVDQKAIGKNSRSNPATYTGAFDLIRNFYANLKEAKKAKLTKEHFSFNSAKGQCETCKGAGEIAIPMFFMPDVYTTCSACNGSRYKDQVLSVQHKGYAISDLLAMEIGEVSELFKDEPGIHAILDMLCKVGLGYVKLGQSAATLSGGEAQRIKLAKALCDGKAKDTLYILDEPTTGLHDSDVKKLSFIIKELTSSGATIIVIEHNPALISQADYIIELGPVGGRQGGYLLRDLYQ